MNNIVKAKVKFVRNLKGVNFEPNMSKSDHKRVLDMCFDIFEKCGFKCAKLKDISTSTLDKMLNGGILEKDFVDKYINQACGNNESLTIQINGKNHVEIFAIGDNIYEVYEMAKKVDKQACDKLNFAYNDKYGFLTSDIKNIGSGMNIEVDVMLPAISKIYMIESLPKVNDKLSFNLNIVNTNCGLVRVSTQGTLGYTEKQICELTNAYIDKLIKLEIETSSKLLSEDEDEILDALYRAKAILKNCVKISVDEVYKLAGDVLIGINAGCEKEIGEQQIMEILNNINYNENNKQSAKNVQKILNNKK